MEKKFLICVFLFICVGCKNDKDFNLEIISKHYNNIGDSIIFIEHKKEFGYEYYNCEIKKKPINITKDITGFIKSEYQIVDDNMIIYSIILGNGINNFKNKIKDDRVKLIKNGILKEIKPYHNDRLDGLIFIFNKENNYIKVKETLFTEEYNKQSNYFYKVYGKTTKDSFMSLSDKLRDSILIKTYLSLWKKKYPPLARIPSGGSLKK
jgi:hypothetical protein